MVLGFMMSLRLKMALSRMPMHSIDSHPITITIQTIRPVYQNNALSIGSASVNLRPILEHPVTAGNKPRKQKPAGGKSVDFTGYWQRHID
jgi:hypothetical protein